MKLKDFLEPLLVPIPFCYLQQLRALYKELYDVDECSSCGALWLRQMVSYLDKQGKEVILDSGVVSVVSFKTIPEPEPEKVVLEVDLQKETANVVKRGRPFRK